MIQNIANRLSSLHTPSLQPATEAYLEDTYAEMLQESTSIVSEQPSSEELRRVINDGLHKIDYASVDIALATYFTWRVRDLMLDSSFFDIEELSSKEIEERDCIGDILRKGVRYSRVSPRQFDEKLIEPDAPYSPKLVACLAVIGLKDVCQFDSLGEIKRLSGVIQLSPLQKKRITPQAR